MRTKKSLVVLLVQLLAAASWCAAQSPSSTKGVGMTAIHAGRLIDVRSGKVIPNAYIVVEKDRITQIVHSLPSGATEIDLSKYSVVPGLIDVHSHVLGNPKDQSSTAGLRMSSAQAAIWGVRNLTVWLDHGFTVVRDACESDDGYGQLALRNSVEKGVIRGPRLFSAGGCISLTGGHGDRDVLAPTRLYRQV